MRFLTLCLFATVALASFPRAALGQGEIRVVTTLPTYAAITREIAGDHAIVEAIARGDEDPHFVNPRPSYAARVQRADMFVATGLDLELWVPAVLNRANNSRVTDGSPGNVVAYAGVTLLDVPENVSRIAEIASERANLLTGGRSISLTVVLRDSVAPSEKPRWPNRPAGYGASRLAVYLDTVDHAARLGRADQRHPAGQQCYVRLPVKPPIFTVFTAERGVCIGVVGHAAGRAVVFDPLTDTERRQPQQQLFDHRAAICQKKRSACAALRVRNYAAWCELVRDGAKTRKPSPWKTESRNRLRVAALCDVVRRSATWCESGGQGTRTLNRQAGT